ncbi:DUF128 domain-containing protein [Chloroflexota bacterium]
MKGSDSLDVERKVIAILRILKESTEPLGARIVSRRLDDYGIDLTERAVRYHLKLMDERGLTQAIGRDGRLITPSGVEELNNALVGDKVGFVINRIELMAFRTTFDWETRSGSVPVNISLFSQRKFPQALKAIRNACKAGICVSELVAIAEEGEQIGETVVPPGKVGLATVCSIVINGALLKAGIPADSRFGGILQIRNREPLRFVELIQYSGSSLDPSTVFIRGKMTSVCEVARKGNGKILANFREIPAQCRPVAEQVITKLKEARIGGLVVMGNNSEPVCELPVEQNRVGIVLLGGLNPVAAAEEAGVETESISMSSAIDYKQLRSIWEL